jgi:D-alanyl-D-alanine dipeptidase
MNISIVAVLFVLLACNFASSDQAKETKFIKVEPTVSKINMDSIQPSVQKVERDTLPTTPRTGAWKTLIDLQIVDPSIRIDLKYATTDNFMKMKLYDTITKIYLQKDVAERLSKCQAFLKTINEDLSLLVYDGVRPVSVQYKMWNALDTIPVNQRVKFVSNPANGSIHNYGAAVDLTICDKNGVPLDMGAGYDDIRKIAYPKMEAHFLANGMLTLEQVENRKMLRKIMTSQNFRNISTEWWHFNACSREAAKAKYLPLK